MAYIINIDGGSGITAQEAAAMLATKQDKLVSGTNIKTVNSQSLLGAGDISITPAVQENSEEE
jgi:hypothetical protein